MVHRKTLIPLLAVAMAGITFAQSGRALAQEESGLTYFEDILPIFRQHCTRCHRPEGSAHKQLLEPYKKGRSWFRTAEKEIKDFKMPPWHVDPEIGEWKNRDSMSEDEIAMIEAWIDDRAPEGDPANGPPPADFPESWLMGEPDLVLEMAEPQAVSNEGPEFYRAFVLSPEFTEDTWLSGIELFPGVRDAVQHVALSAAPTAIAKAADDGDDGPGFAAFDRGWTDGAKDDLAYWSRGMYMTEPFPEGTGVLVPKGWSLVLLVHYKPFKEEAQDRSRVGLHLADGPPARELHTAAVESRDFTIPAETYGHVLKADLTFEKAITIYNILPRMNYLGTQMELTAHKPDGSAEKLIVITRNTYALQAKYTPVKPISLPAGTRLEVVATYENSVDNINNPNLSIRDATYGPAPKSELLSAVIEYTED